MRQNQVVKIAIIVGVSLLILLVAQMVLGAGIASFMSATMPTMTPLEQQFEALQIRLEDLPSGWKWGGIKSEPVPGAEGRFLWYYGPSGESKSWINVSQEIAIYPDIRAASKAYEEWSSSYSEKWITPPDLEIVGGADQMYIMCLPGYVNGVYHLSCEAVGLYGNVLSVLSGNIFEDQLLTMADFQRALGAMDRRIVLALELE